MPLTKVKNISTETAGTSNFVLGVNAGNSIASGGNFNVCIGDEAGTALTTGDQNVAMGYQSLDANDEGIRNVAIGTNALTSDTKGEANTAIGHSALYTQNFTSSTGSSNTAVGYHAGLNLTTGQENLLMGGSAGDTITDGLRNTILGNNADCNASADDTIVIGATCVSASDGYITMGRGSGTERIYNLPTSNASWSHTSDERFKKDITTNTDCGLDFINELRTVTYKWKAPSELDKSFSSYDKDKTEASYANKIYGLIAQEVKSAMDKHNITNFDGWGEVGDEKIQSISEAMFVFPLIKAVQELSAKVDALEVRIKKLEDA